MRIRDFTRIRLAIVLAGMLALGACATGGDSRPGPEAAARGDTDAAARGDTTPGARGDTAPGARSDTAPGTRGDAGPGARADTEAPPARTEHQPPRVERVQPLVIKGAMTYRERIALPPDASAVVELREGAGAEARVVAEYRTLLKGRQVPIPFELSVERARLAAGARHALRGAILVGGHPAWTTEPVVIDPASPGVDTGVLRLVRYQPLAFASTLRCGERSVSIGYAGDTLRMLAAGESIDLRPVRSASGARYEAIGDRSTTFWSKGDRATVVVHGQPWPECVAEAAPGLPFRALGNEPGWRLDITAAKISLQADNGRTRIEAPTPVPEGGDGYTRFRAPAAGVGLVVTIHERRCIDSMTGMPYPGEVVVAFAGRTLKGCGGDPATLLQGDEWVVETLSGGTPVEGARATLRFSADGRVSGRAACNSYTAAYALTGEGLAITQTASTMAACEPALMRQERLMLDLLGQVRRFTIDAGGALVLQASGERTITARRATALRRTSTQ